MPTAHSVEFGKSQAVIAVLGGTLAALCWAAASLAASRAARTLGARVVAAVALLRA